LIEEALAELKGSVTAARVIQLEADPRDRAVLEGILHEMQWELSVRYVLDCWGGLVAKSEDGRVVAINTMEARSERATPHLCRYLAALFENEGPEVEVSQVAERQLVSI
jgi:vacuolar-type H+-ATPase subunit E/Vma4